jgi:hypothetical protein
MFRLLGDSNTKENVIIIQGTQTASDTPVSSILFQNYDIKTKIKHNMVALSCYDHHNDELLSKYGDFSIRTVSESNGQLTEKFRLHHDGIVQIGSNATSNALLNVAGDLSVMSNISAKTLNLNTINAQTKRIVLKGSNTSDSVLTLNISSSNIQGILPSNILPKDVSFSNIETINTKSTNISTTKVMFGGNATTVSSMLTNDIYYFKDWTEFPLTISNVNLLSNIVVNTNEYRVINKTVDITTSFDFISLDSNLDSFSYSLPYSQSIKNIKTPAILMNKTNNTFNTILASVNSNAIDLTFSSNLNSNVNYEISCSLSYIVV